MDKMPENFIRFLIKAARRLVIWTPKRILSAFVIRIFTSRGIGSSIPEYSLLHYYRNIHSQVGQDGILEEIFRRLGVTNSGLFVEFGAWDGVYLSNCRALFELGWGGVFIEGDSEKFTSLVENYSGTEIVCINEFVGTGEKNEGPLSKYRSLDKILADYLELDATRSIDLVSIDIDGFDLEIATSMTIQPRVILIEGGTNLSPFANAPFPGAGNNQQHPLRWIIKEMRRINYEPVCFNQDLYAVRRDLASQVLPQAASLNAWDLYAHSFAFRGKEFRRNIIEFRALDSEIRDFEKKELGRFRDNPLARLW